MLGGDPSFAVGATFLSLPQLSAMHTTRKLYVWVCVGSGVRSYAVSVIRGECLMLSCEPGRAHTQRESCNVLVLSLCRGGCVSILTSVVN